MMKTTISIKTGSDRPLHGVSLDFFNRSTMKLYITKLWKYVARADCDDNYGHPVAKLGGSNHYLFEKGIIGTYEKSIFGNNEYIFDYYSPKDILPPKLIEYNENTKKYNYLRSYKTIWLYAVFLYGLYCLLIMYSIDMTLLPIWLDEYLPIMLFYSAFTFAVLFVGPRALFELKTTSDEWHEKIIIQQKNAPKPEEYKVRHYTRLTDQLVEELGQIAKISVILAIIAFRASEPQNISIAMATLDLAMIFLIMSIMWIFIRIYFGNIASMDLFRRKSKIEILKISDFFELLEQKISVELSMDKTPIDELIGKGPGETETLEFKSSYWTETKGESKGNQNRCLEDAIVKEIAAFLNMNGGVLLIGVEDGSPYNPTNTLEQDLEQFSKDNTIGHLELHISQILENNLICKDSLNGFWRIRFPEYRGVQIIRIDIDKGPRHVLALQPNEQKRKNADKKKQFHFWRQNSRSIQPSLETWGDHIRDNWSD